MTSERKMVKIQLVADGKPAIDLEVERDRITEAGIVIYLGNYYTFKGLGNSWASAIFQQVNPPVNISPEQEADEVEEPEPEPRPYVPRAGVDYPPEGWIPSYQGDQSWRGRGYNPGSGYDG